MTVSMHKPLRISGLSLKKVQAHPLWKRKRTENCALNKDVAALLTKYRQDAERLAKKWRRPPREDCRSQCLRRWKSLHLCEL